MIRARAAATAALDEEVEQLEEIKNQGPRRHPKPKGMEEAHTETQINTPKHFKR